MIIRLTEKKLKQGFDVLLMYLFHDYSCWLNFDEPFFRGKRALQQIRAMAFKT